ncbi:MAG: hypothetical protein CVV08_12995 [Gammaproteobacteria bacterium HGW-Gammaproteobacteria-12]|nr:MAG: hypothetical protein CVV08_12995 [Gammaproteobacteria bacterium HGW-Gammaproteobacteria-12]
MPFHRFLALFVATALCATANLSVAEQISGQLQISLTILKRCEVAVRDDAAAVHLSARDCEHAAYQVQDAHGRALPSTLNAQATSLALPASGDAGSTLVIYW